LRTDARIGGTEDTEGGLEPNRAFGRRLWESNATYKAILPSCYPDFGGGGGGGGGGGVLRGPMLHVGPSQEERHADVEVVGHGLALDQAELADVVAVVRRVDHVRVVQLPRLHQHLIHLGGRGRLK